MPIYLIVILCLLLAIPPLVRAAKPIPQVMLAQTQHLSSLPLDTSGYFVSEKYDGVRAYWTGSQFITRKGYRISAPEWFTEAFPSEPMDGELWIERGKFAEVSAAIRRYEPNHSEWRKIKFMVFDLPITGLAFHQRFAKLMALFTTPNVDFPSWLRVVAHKRFERRAQVQAYFDDIVTKKGEGIMLNVSNATYQPGRSQGLLKIKPSYDADAVVIAHQPGKGKYLGMMGALWVRNDEGIKFKIGTGFSDDERRAPPEIGATISYQYSGFNRTGIPRFARFLRVRNDL